MRCPYCGYVENSAGPAHICPVNANTSIAVPGAASASYTVSPVVTGGYVPAEIDVLRAQNAALHRKVAQLLATVSRAEDANGKLLREVYGLTRDKAELQRQLTIAARLASDPPAPGRPDRRRGLALLILAAVLASVMAAALWLAYSGPRLEAP